MKNPSSRLDPNNPATTIRSKKGKVQAAAPSSTTPVTSAEVSSGSPETLMCSKRKINKRYVHELTF